MQAHTQGGNCRGIRSRPTPKREIEGNQISGPHPRGEIQGDQDQTPPPPEQLLLRAVMHPTGNLQFLLILSFFLYFLCFYRFRNIVVKINP